MVVVDPLANALNSITNSEKRAKKEAIIAPASRMIIEVLRLLQREGYLGEIEYIDDGRQGKVKVQLLGRINRAAAIKPRYSIKKYELTNLPTWIKKKLPSREIGVLILSTPMGIMSSREALEKGTGGVILGYVY